MDVPPPEAFLEQNKEPGSIIFEEECILPCVSSENDRVAGAGEVATGFSCHALWVSVKHPFLKSEPNSNSAPQF